MPAVFRTVDASVSMARGLRASSLLVFPAAPTASTVIGAPLACPPPRATGRPCF
ncbi:hypothetical protein [Stenotrophomonas sp. HMWF003]|jgi:hypothetical protein|uniref:hypothetical protein n=1 Tax=Stenotrophomonas sp. HMWF003 TaxID=2056840 RepID=UPI0015E82C50|nr:hypothetical protein [Stenotrophomonas sp. HMWF003]